MAWAVALLALAAPASTFVAKESGERLYERVLGQGFKGKGLEILNSHMDFGTKTFWFSLALGIVSLVVVGLTWRRSARLPLIAEGIMAVVMIVLAAAAGYYVYKTGDSGATAVWGQY